MPSQVFSSSLVIFIIILILDQRVEGHKDVDNNLSSKWPSHVLQDSWPVRFLSNCAGYLWVVVPLALLVYLVKQGHLGEGVTTNKYIRLLVYGNEVDGIAYAQLPITNALIKEEMMMGEGELREKWLRDLLQLLFCFVGLQVSYLTWGLLQEKIMTQSYLVEIAFFSGHHEDGAGHDVNAPGLITLSRIGLFCLSSLLHEF